MKAKKNKITLIALSWIGCFSFGAVLIFGQGLDDEFFIYSKAFEFEMVTGEVDSIRYRSTGDSFYAVAEVNVNNVVFNVCLVCDGTDPSKYLARKELNIWVIEGSSRGYLKEEFPFRRDLRNSALFSIFVFPIGIFIYLFIGIWIWYFVLKSKYRKQLKLEKE